VAPGASGKASSAAAATAMAGRRCLRARARGSASAFVGGERVDGEEASSRRIAQ
jgi:hypothetical protein